LSDAPRAPATRGVRILRTQASPGRREDGMNVLIIEDHTMVRDLLELACAQVLPGARVTTRGTCAGALAAARENPPELVLLDLVLPDGDGLDLLPALFGVAPGAKVIALSSHIDEFTLHRAMSSSVHGILDKNEQPVRILREAIQTVLAGGQYLSSFVKRLKASIRADPTAFDKILSDREQQVLRLIGEGLVNDQIAARLGISLSTAKHHRLNIMAKLDMHSTPQLIRYAIEKGFARIPEGQPPRT
jgi:two-component system response regulator NreC